MEISFTQKSALCLGCHVVLCLPHALPVAVPLHLDRLPLRLLLAREPLTLLLALALRCALVFAAASAYAPPIPPPAPATVPASPQLSEPTSIPTLRLQ